MIEPVLHEVIDGLEVLICGLDSDGTIHVFNWPCERVTGLSREHAVGKSWLELFARGHRADHVQALWSQAREDEPAGPYEALCRNGRRLRWHVARRGSPVPRVALWAVGLDVTEEREALARARELERVASLGNLVAGLTHELRNPLNGALLQLAVAQRTLVRHDDPWAAAVATAVERATGEMRRMSTILDDFLLFVRPQPLSLEQVDVRAVAVRASERSAARAAAAAVVVTVEPGPEVLVEIDPARVESALYQLLANAIDAAGDSADREVRLRVLERGNAVVIEVADRGPGLPAGDLHVFEPFFTTKDGGTGLGLSIVERVAADHGGAVGHERRDGATVFRLELPVIGGATHETERPGDSST